MRTSERVAKVPREYTATPTGSSGLIRKRRTTLTGGGPDGNEQLTAVTGVILIVLLALIGFTILRLRQLISVHLFVGLLLVGPVALKTASTGYRFVRYYTRDPQYRRKGPPELFLRLIGPVVVITTVIVFASGIVLLFDGPRDRGAMLTIHKFSFVGWLAFTALHVLRHLPGLRRSLRAVDQGESHAHGAPGAAGRAIATAGVLAGGLVLAIVLIGQFGAWTAPGAFVHHHH